MEYYIPNSQPLEAQGAERQENIITDLSSVPEDKALIVQVDNGHFKANALAYSQKELERFNNTRNDLRPIKYYLMDKEKAHKLSNYQIY